MARRMSLDNKIGLVAFMLIAAGVVGALGAKCFGAKGWEYSSGSRSGVVQKLSKKGAYWKTWEGELNLGYNEAHGGGNSQTLMRPAMFRFSIADDEIAKAVKEAEVRGDRVTLEYKQYVLHPYSRGGTDYEIVGVTTEAADVTR